MGNKDTQFVKRKLDFSVHAVSGQVELKFPVLLWKKGSALCVCVEVPCVKEFRWHA